MTQQSERSPEGGQVQIRAKEDDMKGVYSNLMQVGHTREEFILDFFNIVPNAQAGVLASRVILSPGHFKRMSEAIKINLQNYEKQFGEIYVSEAPSQEIGFRG